MFGRKLLSICIPSYNRPEQLVALLQSIDCDPEKVEVLVCEDNSPKREQIREKIETFKQDTRYRLRYYENERNLGYDGNLRRLVHLATGMYVMFMGDDDLFIPGALDRYMGFLSKNLDRKYILRSYQVIHHDGNVEYFRYLPESRTLPAGEETVAWLFKRSVTICGFTISRDEAQAAATSDLDGTLLYQVYLMARICLFNESAYCDIPIVQAVQTFREDKPMFGTSEAEKGRYTPGAVTQDNSINFTKAYFEVTKYLDKQHGTNLTLKVRFDLSKYSYPFLSIQRKRGLGPFLKYAKRLETEVGFGCTPYFYIYKWALVLFGESVCDRLIMYLKRCYGYTPNF